MGGRLMVTADTIPTVVPIVSTTDVAIDTTISAKLDVTAAWATKDAGNTLTVANVVIELLDPD